MGKKPRYEELEERVKGLEKEAFECKQAQEAPRQSENEYGTSLETLPRKIFHKELAEKYRADDRRIIESGKTEDIEEKYLRDGREIWVNTVKAPVKDRRGNVQGVLGIFWDITERKQAEKAIRESEEKFKAIAGSAKDAIIMMDNEGDISYWNKAAEEIFGYSAHEALGKELHLFLAPRKYHDAYARGILTFKRTGRGHAVGKTLELEAVRENGTKFPIELSVSAVKIEGKWHATGIVRDISQRKQAEEALQKAHDELERRVEERTARLARTTEQLKLELAERKRVEESLRQSEERFRSVAQTANDGIITVDSRGSIVFWNDAADKIFGYSGDEVIGKPLTFVMPERFGKDQKNGLERAFLTGQPGIVGKTVEKVGRRKNGGEFPVELSLASWKTKEGTFFTGIVRDVTERRRAEEEIRYLSRQLIGVIEEERKRLARDLHDEFGQAVTGLHFAIGALHNSLPQELKDQRTRCDELIGLIEQLGDIIRNISSELRPDMLDHLGLIPTLESYIEDFVKRREGLRIDFKAVGVKKRPDPEIEIVVYRFLQEALNNIAKHAQANHVSVLLTYSHPKLIFTIKDDGVGFDLVTVGDNGGMGLTSMRERAEKIDGMLDITSASGEGTRVRVGVYAKHEPRNRGAHPVFEEVGHG